MARSLRWRIQIWHGAILTVVIVLFGAITYVQQRTSCTATIDNELRSAAEVLTGQLRSASAGTLQGLQSVNGDSRDAAAQKLFDDLQVPRTFAPRRYHHDYEHPYFVIRGSDGELVKSSDSAPESAFQRITVLPLGADRSSLVPSFSDQGRDENQEYVSEGPQGMLVLVGRNVHADYRDLKNLAYLLIGSGITVFAVGLLGGWSLSGATMRPIAEITRAAAEISEANLSNRIDAGETDAELQQLATTLNETFARLQLAFERQVQFTTDASHELRTPLAVVQMHQELALSKDRSPEEYREAIQTCQRATARMNALVESLLTLARLDTDASPVVQEQVDLAALVIDCVEQVQPLADAKRVTIKTQVASGVFVSGSTNQLAQVMTNLLTNAMAYSSPEADVSVVVDQRSGEVVVSVSDTGDGIPATDLPHVFERFYRVDKQRTRDSGGSGLGLSICQQIMTAHGGRIAAESVLGEGSTFRLTFPAADSVR